jgi:outer membrane immunogenic protein
MRGDHSLLGIFQGQQSMRWSWAVGGRVGWLVTPSLLAYVSGGFTEAEFGGVNYGNSFASSTLVLSNPATSLVLVSNGLPGIQLGSQRYDGFFIGGGTEYAIGWLPGLFWKSEYRYADYRSATTNIICVTCTVGVPGPVGQTGLAERQHTTVQTVRTELVWRFNWGGPSVVAKY